MLKRINMEELLKKAKSQTVVAASLSTKEKNCALNLMADELINKTQEILSANDIDVKNATSLSSVMVDRLKLTAERIKGMADGMREVALLPDPVGRVISRHVNKDGLEITKTSVPFGVVAVIFESRPNVSSDTAALCLKSGNVCVLRGGKESFYSCLSIVSALKEGLKKAGLSEDLINVVNDKSRESANYLMTANKYVDLLIPRGGAGLIRACVENATVPCIETGTGICHVYVDAFADLDMAVKIINNAKTSRPSVCNAEEVCLVHKDVANKFLPMLKEKLVDERIKNNLTPVELRLCERSSKIIDGKIATNEDFDTEFLDYILAVKIVDGIDSAITHVSNHSTHHSDAIISNDQNSIDKFVLSVDSAAVYVNASTRFTDGGEFGNGCEIGISTQKLHARGPMGLNELNSYKYVIKGNGQVR